MTVVAERRWTGSGWLGSRAARMRRGAFPYLLLAPGLGVVLALILVPAGQLVALSFEVPTLGGSTLGTANWRNLWLDGAFRNALVHNAYLLLTIPVLLVLSVLFAALIHDGIRGWKLYQSVVFLPIILAIPVIGATWSYVLTLHGGLNTVLERVGLGFAAHDWLGDQSTALLSVGGVIAWRELGFGIILVLARMTTIPPSLYDAARVDGAGWFARHRFVTLPQLRGVLEFYTVVLVIGMFTYVFSYAVVMTNGGPADATLVTELYIYRKAFTENQFGMAAAAALILWAIVSVLVWIFYVVRDKSQTS